ncbi:MAG: methyltransferase domain-containing protein [Cyclobacteriaceae bacterium]|jgi:SAM-dependent methyltransferase
MALPEVPHSRQLALDYFERYVHDHASTLSGKAVYDLSAGSGYIAGLFHHQGAHVHLYDLFPEHNQLAEVPCGKIDLQQPFPIGDGVADIVISSETIEHLPDQYHFFREAARILKPGGYLLLTTPNTSSLRSRFAQFLGESEHYATPLPNEHEAFVRWPGSTHGYFGKIFLSGILRLRLLAALNGLRIHRVVPTKTSSTSTGLMILYPLIWFFSRRAYQKKLRAHPGQQVTLNEIYELSTSGHVLRSKHLIVEWVKK